MQVHKKAASAASFEPTAKQADRGLLHDQHGQWLADQTSS